jgi:hypothetical protein
VHDRRRAAVIQTPPTRRGGADLQRQGWSLVQGAPSDGGTQTAVPGTLRGCLPSSPLRLSQDFNIFSTYFTDGTGRLRYISDAQVDKYLASIGGLSRRCGTIASGRVQLRRRGEPQGNDMNHRDHTQVPPSHAARHIPGNPTARDYAVKSDPGLYRRSAVPRQTGRLECQGPRLCPLQTLFATITLQVDAEVARALTAASPQEQRKIHLLLRLRLQDLTSAPSCTMGVAIPCAFHLWWALFFHVVPARQTGGRDPPR